MKNLAWTVLFLSAVLAADGGPAPELRRDILGLRLNMSREEAGKRLREIGSFERDERKQQEIWKLRDGSFSHLIVAFGKEDGKVRFVTAVAREDAEAKRLRYSDVGKLDEARQVGDAAIKNFNYEWTLPAGNGSPPAQVNARGRDAEFLSTYSIKRTEGATE
ncbi:MAG: hypothetical protein ABR589_07625 [Chthoniobacterales bacterium]